MDGWHQVFHNSNMLTVAQPRRRALPTVNASGLPTYTLYGEADDRPATDWLHCESIAERSRRHHWEIKLHRHAALFQILYIRRGTGQATIDGQTRPLRGPCVLSVPALVPHGFRFKPASTAACSPCCRRSACRLLAAAPALPSACCSRA